MRHDAYLWLIEDRTPPAPCSSTNIAAIGIWRHRTERSARQSSHAILRQELEYTHNGHTNSDGCGSKRRTLNDMGSQSTRPLIGLNISPSPPWAMPIKRHLNSGFATRRVARPLDLPSVQSVLGSGTQRSAFLRARERHRKRHVPARPALRWTRQIQRSRHASHRDDPPVIKL